MRILFTDGSDRTPVVLSFTSFQYEPDEQRLYIYGADEDWYIENISMRIADDYSYMLLRDGYVNMAEYFGFVDEDEL